MTPYSTARRTAWLLRPLVGAMAAVAVLSMLLVRDVGADPAADALARMNELSRQAEQTTEAMHTAEIDLDAKLVAQRSAEDDQRADQLAVDSANAELSTYQAVVDDIAAAAYMGGSTDGIAAILTASSPRQLIAQLSVQQTMSTQMSLQLTAFKTASQRAAEASVASADSAALARATAEQSAGVRAELQAKQSELMRKIGAVKAQYEALTPDQRAILAQPGPPPPPLPSAPPPTDPAIVAMPGPTLGDPALSGVAPPAGAPSGEGIAVVQAALTRVGAPYSWGATGPDAFDCSGLIKWAFLQNGKSLPRSSQALAAGGQPVATAEVQPGDIVTFYSDASHAGIYIGDGNMVHASTYGTPVKVAPISSAPIYNVRRY